MVIDTSLFVALVGGVVLALLWTLGHGEAFVLRGFVTKAIVFVIILLIALSGPIKIG